MSVDPCRSGQRRAAQGWTSRGRRIVLVLLVVALADFGALTLLASSANALTCPAGQWAGDYFEGTEPTGTPVDARCDSQIYFDWGDQGPGVGDLGPDDFSVRWKQSISFPTTGTYTFTAIADDGIRVRLDGETVINGWVDQGPTTYSAQPLITAGEHEVVVEYYEHGWGSVVAFDWSGDPPPPPSCEPGEWAAAYYGGRTLSGTPTQQCEAAVDHDWGGGAPGVGALGADNFSVRWTRTETFQAGPVTFTATADDGIRVYLDDVPVIDEWRDQGPTPFTVDVDVTAGEHTVRVEYYEAGGDALVRAGYAAAPTGGDPGDTGEPGDPGEPGVSCTSIQWAAAYFDNTTLAGAPVTERCESSLSRDFGEAGPGVPGIGGYDFSVRWLRTDLFRGGSTTFSVTADDGVRMWLDDTVVIDEWRDQGATLFTATVPVTAGPHTVRVEYYQGGGGGLVRAGYTGGGAPGPLPPPPPGGCTADCQGSWTVLPYEAPVRSIHATVLRTGNVLLVAGSGNNETDFDNQAFVSKVWDPVGGTFADVPTADDLFCVGHTQLPDGRILLAGGTAAYPTATENYYGLDRTYIFDPIAGTYEILGDMPGGGHWYPTLVSLGNGDVFATGGLNEYGSGNVSVEMWDTAGRRWKALNEVQQTYSYWGLYPNMILMSDGRLFYAGTHTFGNALPGTSGSEIYDVDTGTITEVAGLRDIDFRDQGGSVLLPPAQAQKVLTLGGGNTYSPLDPTAKTDIIDLNAPDPAWTPGPDLAAGKMYVSPVILPDGK
ncbi:PA14 domain-containing protein, partial [Frankia sp. EI5c]|uniref:PA14 domain-containing protein n=1 Tax=Frankia sp. EI5c TaxID=683316 RepID=UPI001F5B0B0A